MSARGQGIRNPAVVGLLVSAVIGMGLGWRDASDSRADSIELESRPAVQQRAANRVVARVGQVQLLAVELEAKLQEMELDPSTAGDSEHNAALDALIEEELWLQEALATDRLRHHRGLRDAVARRMLDVIFPAADDFDESALKRLYEEKYSGNPEAPPFAKVRFRLEKEQRRIRNSRALEQYLRWLRQSTEVEIFADAEDLEDLKAEVFGQDTATQGGASVPTVAVDEGGAADETQGKAAGGEGEP